MTRARAWIGVVAAAGVLALPLGGCGGGPTVSVAPVAPVAPVPTPAAAPPAARSPRRPNVVFVLADDLSWNLVRFMPHVRLLRRAGASFTRYFVTDSLCCPSRASIFSGRYPHDDGVFTNTPPDGGFAAFQAHGDERSTFATALVRRGYRTALLGKYLNGYEPRSGYVPPGWSGWDVAGNGYPEFDYDLDQDGSVVLHGHRRRDYLTDVIARRGVSFIDRSAAAHRPFLVELATFAPHFPYTPAPRHAADFPGLRAPRDAAFDAVNHNPPRWLRGRPPLTRIQLDEIDSAYRKRAQAVEAIDDLLGRVERALRANHVLENTYIVFSSDNGYHMGEHRLTPGKLTAFDSDIRVPLVVAGPGVAPGLTVDRLAENIDLRPTFSRLAGARVPPGVDGRSLVGLLRGRRERRWRTAVLVEHHGRVTDLDDPDRQSVDSADPTSYEAMRSAHSVYVEYSDGEHEYYDLDADPAELRNVYAALPARRRAHLHARLLALERCHGRRACWSAA